MHSQHLADSQVVHKACGLAGWIEFPQEPASRQRRISKIATQKPGGECADNPEVEVTQIEQPRPSSYGFQLQACVQVVSLADSTGTYRLTASSTSHSRRQWRRIPCQQASAPLRGIDPSAV